MSDTYWPEPQSTYEERRQAYLAFCAPHTQGGRTKFFSQIARLKLGQDAVDEEPIREAIAFADSRADCGDFAVSGLLRILYLYRDSELISRSLVALINLFDFAEDEAIRKRAGLLIDVVLFEMALHTHRGVFGSTHGRTYPRLIKNGRQESTASVCKLAFGMGVHHNPSSLGAITLATSGYRPLEIFEQIAGDLETPICCRERHSLNIEDAPKHGLSYARFEDGHLYWSIQEYAHPKILPLSQKMTETFGVREYGNYQVYVDAYEKQTAKHGKIVDPHLDCHALTEVHIETYRTADYLLSCAQDYRPGSPGYQQHIWQATLGIDTMVFTNHPGSDNETSRPNFWAGNGVMPRAAQFENVLVCVHRVPKDDAFPFSHAHFPRANFDEIVEGEQWIFGRKDDGYIAMFSQSRVRWVGDEELRVDTPENIWICEMGRREQWGDFKTFVNRVQSSAVHCKGLDIRYISPSLGDITFGWDVPFEMNGTVVSLRTTKRFDNPYCQCDFLEMRVAIQRGKDKVVLDFERNERID